MLYGRIDGLDKRVSRAIIGCDNKLTVDEGAALWEAFVAAGGTGFDTAHIYAQGKCEQALGTWINRQAIEDSVVVTVKGAHTPYCDPENLVSQLHESLERLMLPAADIYIMHRDNPEVPVGEFVDVLNEQADAGLIKVFGGSNWTVDRFRAANAYAASTGKRGMRVLNNNLSLARMEVPVWRGCVSASDDATLSFLTEAQTAHFSWSSQARGYFYATSATPSLPDGTRPDQCFDSPQNQERRRRARQLGEKLGVSAGHIATAYVLNQPFPSFALIGPRTVTELDDTLSGVNITLTPDQRAWLNLRRDVAPA